MVYYKKNYSTQIQPKTRDESEQKIRVILLLCPWVKSAVQLVVLLRKAILFPGLIRRLSVQQITRVRAFLPEKPHGCAKLVALLIMNVHLTQRSCRESPPVQLLTLLPKSRIISPQWGYAARYTALGFGIREPVKHDDRFYH